MDYKTILNQSFNLPYFSNPVTFIEYLKIGNPSNPFAPRGKYDSFLVIV